MSRAARGLERSDDVVVRQTDDHPAPDDHLAPEEADGAVEPGASSRRTGLLHDRVLGLVVLAAAASRFWAIGSPSLWFDEFITYANVQVRFDEMLPAVGRSEGTPPLYFLLEWVWMRLFGRGDAALRSSSALVGTLTVVVMYAVLIELRQSRRAARVAAALVAANPLLIWYSREARAYALFAFLIACSLWCLARALDRRRPADYLLWSLVAAAACATHYFGAFLVVPQAVWLLATMWKDRRWRDAACALVPVAVAGVGLMAMAVRQRSTNQDWIEGNPLSYRLREAGRSFLLGASPPHDLLMIAVVPPLVYAAVALVRRARRRERVAASAMAAVGVAGLVLPLVAANGYFLGRSAIGTVVVLTVPVAIGLAVEPARLGRIATVVLCGVWVATTVWVGVEPALQKPDWNGLATAIDREIRTDDRVVVLALMAMPMQRYGMKGSRLVAEGETIPVQEIVMIYHIAERPRCARWIGLSCELVLWPPTLPPDLAQQFAFSGKIQVGNFSVDRFRSERPVPIQPCRLAGPGCSLVLRPND
jgi:hypothetical protein